MPKNNEKQYQFEVLRTGTFVDANGREVSITKDDLNELSESYDPINAPSPLVAGHPEDNEGALGWADSFKVVGDKLIGFTNKVHENLSNAVKDGLYKKISLSIYDPESTSNPVKGKKYIRHVGFLGASAPAVPGLKTLSFKEDETGYTQIELTETSFSGIGDKETNLFKRFLDYIKDAQEPEEPSKSFTENTETPEDISMTPEEIKQLQSELAASKTENVGLKTKLNISDKEKHENDIKSFCEQMVNDGKIAPAMKDGWVELMSSLPVESIEFSDGNKETLLDKAKDLIKSQSEILDFTEKSKDEDDPNKPVNFAAPHGVQVGKQNIQLHNKITAYQQANKCDYNTALKAVGE